MLLDRSGRINALAFAILDANGDGARLAEQMRFFSDLTAEDVDQAMALAHVVRTSALPSFISASAKRLGLNVEVAA
jgi:hypothetical protein